MSTLNTNVEFSMLNESSLVIILEIMIDIQIKNL